jgi:putative flippase GtrA
MIMVERFFRYCGVALMSTGSDWLVFTALILGVGCNPTPSLMAARLTGGLVSFLTNRQWTWQSGRPASLTQQGRRFLILYGVSYGTAIGLFSLLTEGLEVAPMAAKLVADSFCFLGNFAAMHLYVYHRENGLRRLLGLSN